MIRILSLAIIILTLTSSFGSAKKPSQPTPVIVYEVKKKHFADEVEALGTLRANESVDLTATVTESVTKINFKDNQRVRKGDILVEMDAAEELAELEEQLSIRNEAQRQVDRLTPLVKQGAASESIIDERRREVLSANARINAIQSRVDKRMIKAPYDGVLGLRNISVGALVQPGTLITTIDDVNTMKLDFSVPELFLSSINSGVQIEAKTEAYPKELFEGRIASVDSRIDPVTRSIMARALIENSDEKLKPGLLMHVELQKNPRKVVLIPEEAMIANGSDNFVLVIKELEDMKTVERRNVTLGSRQFGNVEILSGLEPGEFIVTHGTLRAAPGSPVTIKAVEENDETLKELIKQDEDKSAQ